MAEPHLGKAEDVIGSAVSVPISLIVAMTDLLISKGIISKQEMAFLIRNLMERSPTHGENEEMVRVMLGPLLALFEDATPG
jgi:hypothetical protein